MSGCVPTRDALRQQQEETEKAGARRRCPRCRRVETGGRQAQAYSLTSSVDISSADRLVSAIGEGRSRVGRRADDAEGKKKQGRAVHNQATLSRSRTQRPLGSRSSGRVGAETWGVGDGGAGRGGDAN